MGQLRNPRDTTTTAAGCGPFSTLAPTADSLKLSIFERIRAEGAVSRAKIAKDLQISPASVTTQTSALIGLGLVKELPAAPDVADAGRGRPPIALGVNPDAHLVAGVKLSDETHTAVICDFAGAQIASATLASDGRTDAAGIVDAADRLLRKVCTEAGIDLMDLSAIGVGIAGFVTHETGLVHWSSILSPCPVNLSQLLSDRLQRPVTVDNDANLIALAELWFGAGRQISDFSVVTIEHGVGMGLVLNHELYRGARGMGMELGHTKVALDGALCQCGQRGCLEAYISNYALAREATTALKLPPDADRSVKAVLEALHQDAKGGNLAARSIFERAGNYLALALGNVLNLFDPELVILSGERMRFDYLYSDTTLERISRHALNTTVPLPPVEIHAWGDMVWASGAAALALTHVTKTCLDTGISA